ncbi:efflux RND transporter permease subunit [Aestuariivirga sp.]|uniref:efflux RND transporter permease subunit n=1 Tax=Aestuariivirga sp. TaxID=2650926 RepID=UPI00391C9AC2
MFLTRISVANPVFATMMMVAIVVIGLFSYQRLGIDQFPDVDIPTVVVATDYPGASPEAVESDVTEKIEDAVNTISGVDTVTSRSYEGVSVVIVEFSLQTSSETAAQEVREKVAAVRGELREEVEDPKVTRFDPASAPIVSVAVEGPGRSLRDLTTLADETILKRFQTVPGVGSATIVGGVRRQIDVLLKPERLEAFGIGIDQVLDTIRSENQDLPAGSVTSGREDRVVQIEGAAKTPDELGRFILAQREGVPVRLADVAEIADSQEEKASLASFNGKPALAIDIVKVQGANTIAVADGIFAALARMNEDLPADVKLSVVRDSSKGIRSSVSNVRSTLIEGGFLTIAIVFLFLHSWRSTVITGLTLPVSVIGTFAALAFFGFTLNTMTLMALSLAIGILIDDAIVVRENISRHLAMGKDHVRAALEGTREIGLAVLATTLAIVAVFAPLAFMGGIIGQFFFEFGITVAVAVLISLFVSFTLDPMLSSVWPDPDAERRPRGPLGWLAAGIDWLMAGILAIYHPLLRFSLRRRWVVVIAALALFFGSFTLVAKIGTEFVPSADMGEISVKVAAPVGSSLDYTESKLRQVEAALKEFPEIDYTYATINSGDASGKNQASIFVALKPIGERVRSAEALVDLMRQRLSSIAGLELSLGLPGVGNGKPIQISVQGPDTAELARISQQVRGLIAEVPGVVDIESSLKAARPTLDVTLDQPLASDLGISLRSLSETLRVLLAGQDVSSFRSPAGENYDVNVRLPESDRRTAEDLSRLPLSSTLREADGSARMVPLREVAKLEPGFGPSQINRRDLTREVQITANKSGRAAGDINADIANLLKTVELPPGYGFAAGGAAENIAETSGEAGRALILAVVFIYIVLASQFGSFLQPLAIMTSLPLSLIGVFLGLLAWGSTLNLFSAIGFIMLMGLVVKNAILLVDFINQARAGGMERTTAIMRAADVRLRPILMTTLAMIFGMVPLALGLGEGGQQRAGMAHAVIGGLISSSILTLVVVPVVLTLFEDLAGKLGFGRQKSAPAEAAPKTLQPRPQLKAAE